ncbi:alpha/beta-hydrolase [Dentipellis sp. KUC8613]|nr:alpha/beta-hydrolase [Dentipellis sp. KUC8613]
MEWLSRQLPNIEWILPQADARPVTYSHGQLRPSWFNIATLPPGYAEWDEVAVSLSVNLVESIIQSEIHGGVDSRKIVLVGFSQGAALSLMVALTSLHELGGVASLSGWIPHNSREHIIHSEPSLPVFWGYGRDDTEIPPYHSEESMGFLRDVVRLPMHLLTYRRYENLAHTVNGPELSDLATWLLRILNLQPVVNGY